MNKIMAEYWFYLVVYFITLCIFGTISIRRIKAKNVQDNERLKDKIWYKILMIILNYGITVLVAVFFIQYALDIPYAIKNNFKISEGNIVHVYKDEIDLGDSSYTVITNGLKEGDNVRVHYLPYSKCAPIVEKIE